ncbi:hypothetical protein [Sphingorhabdus sp.]|jgi:hypothetical protein|uniref:hypothetical protein n=1 Tax=Sphingorhabdus sp. TaxID=1902408 RepID=UPI0037C98863
MSRKTREIRLESEERWPALRQVLCCCGPEDWDRLYSSPEGAVDAAIADYPLPVRQQALKEWCDWNTDKGIQYDPRDAVNDGLGVNVLFKKPEDARKFMNMVYDKLIVSVRSETSKDWMP